MTKRTTGCLGAIAVMAIALYLAAQTELGKWLGALVFVYGGAILGTAMLHDSLSATVVKVQPRDHEMFNGIIELSYVDSTGTEHRVHRNALGSPGQLEGIEVGDRLTVLVCKRNPSSVKIPSLQAPGGPPCTDPGKSETATAS